MRNIKGKVVLPSNVPTVKAGQVTIEIRDVSVADAPSTIVAQRQLEDVALEPNGEIEFKIPVPDVESNQKLGFRVHVSLDGSGTLKSGDLLTTTHVAVPVVGKTANLEVPVEVI